MKVEIVRSELQRLMRQSPFMPFLITLKGGERAMIEHPENVAFDPTPGSWTRFHVLTGSAVLYSTFEDVSSMSLLAGGGEVAGQSNQNGSN